MLPRGRPTLIAILILILTLAMPPAAFASHAASDVAVHATPENLLTDLGPGGNQAVAKRYERYSRNPQHCESSGAGEAKRVLLTGFGLFKGVPLNISGALIENFNSPEIWPEVLETESVPPHPPGNHYFATGILKESDNGAKIFNRRLTINSHDYDVCFVILDVLWDFAGAAIVSEMERFQPDLVIMSGRGNEDLVLEGAASNLASSLSGYQSNGNPDEQNKPIGTTIDSSRDAGAATPFTWRNEPLSQAISQPAHDLGFRVWAPESWRTGNDYICNNVSFIALSAAAGARFKLAGDLIEINASIRSRPQIGFVHLPKSANLTPETAPSWVLIYSRLIDESFH